jgi:hypothetical protein
MNQRSRAIDETVTDHDPLQHFKQTANGLDIDNADFNVNVSQDFQLEKHR